MMEHAWWLLCGVVGMYLYDAVLLLFHNEVVFYERRDGRWSFSIGSDFELGGRHVYVPPLFSPTSALLRLRWSTRAAPGRTVALRGLRAWRVATRAMVPRTLAVVIFFAAMPAALQSNGLVLITWFVALYASIVLAVLKLWRLRKVSGLARKDALGISSDALLCAPFAIDILRKQGLKVADRFDVVDVAHALLDADERRRLAEAIRSRLQRQMDLEDPESERHAMLRGYADDMAGALA